MRRRLRLVGALVVAAVTTAGCQSGDSGAVPSGPVVVTVDAQDPGTTFDRRLLGTNLPAWVGPGRLADPAFRAGVVSSGTTVIRMPGGSWSDDYDWSACENETSDCPFLGSARPSDFLGFLQATGLAGMWTVNVNETAQQAAALVAFFNGRTDDERPIGVDRNGVDWKTVGTWARLRASHGHAQPLPVALWEVGNETYGGKGDGDGDGDCASFAWEHSWTCDGAAYVTGDSGHDGFVAIAAAMKAADPTIEVGAVGVADGAAWGRWGDEVVHGAAGSMDFYVVHQYAFDGRPSVSGALRQPSGAWERTLAAVRDTQRGSTPVPLAVT
ncbi:MAG: alpha-L-arabinofuranosidase, partial [Ilumatobacteraceae bacterium]